MGDKAFLRVFGNTNNFQGNKNLNLYCKP